MPNSPHPMLIAHNKDIITSLREVSRSQPLRLLTSACMVGEPCGIDGSDYGMGGTLAEFESHPLIKMLPFCPERSSMGVPRGMPDIHGGDGFDVIAGRAKVLDENSNDLTEAMIAGAQNMLKFAMEEKAELAILTDMSAACGSQVISDGCRLRENRRYQVGVGVATALLLEYGIPCCSQRDFKSLALLQTKLGIKPRSLDDGKDHHMTDWFLETFGDRSS
ncbi:MAG: DUF523 domain-containing protein [Pseudobacteriovorax sp.]|nr:DUF523 domain-containing protein [Pseudobacteriovorax sp.]